MSSYSGVIFDIKRFAVHDGPGIRTTIFFKGCPLNCWFCHNPESQNPLPEEIMKGNSTETEIVGKQITVNEILTEIRKDIIFYDESGGGVTYSGGEPLMQAEFLHAIIKECQKEEIHTVLDTTGYGSLDLIKSLQGKVDLYLFDIKFIDEAKHIQFVGVSNKNILNNLRFLDSTKQSVFIRVPLIPGFTDTEENIHAIGSYITSLTTINHIDILPYNRFGEEKYHRLNREFKLGERGHIQTQSENELHKIKNILESYNLTVKIGE